MSTLRIFPTPRASNTSWRSQGSPDERHGEQGEPKFRQQGHPECPGTPPQGDTPQLLSTMETSRISSHHEHLKDFPHPKSIKHVLEISRSAVENPNLGTKDILSVQRPLQGFTPHPLSTTETSRISPHHEHLEDFPHPKSIKHALEISRSTMENPNLGSKDILGVQRPPQGTPPSPEHLETSRISPHHEHLKDFPTPRASNTSWRSQGAPDERHGEQGEPKFRHQGHPGCPETPPQGDTRPGDLKVPQMSTMENPNLGTKDILGVQDGGNHTWRPLPKGTPPTPMSTVETPDPPSTATEDTPRTLGHLDTLTWAC
ncbi:uncharacterized protein LOC117009511 [Catharus ustulatus]|uniref:uncharacterized protein LOC117009511 n=1 Tax=Catharus ustulatus TaxID=91951 RepID=UPI001409B5A3|nr:uncharacterized protein LOC117009511 [Catharus ustulatus]